MDNAKIKQIKANNVFDGSIGRMYINSVGIDRYVDDSGEVTLVLVSNRGKWLDSVKPCMTDYNRIYNEAADGRALLIALGTRYFERAWR